MRTVYGAIIVALFFLAFGCRSDGTEEQNDAGSSAAAAEGDGGGSFFEYQDETEGDASGGFNLMPDPSADGAGDAGGELVEDMGESDDGQ